MKIASLIIVAVLLFSNNCIAATEETSEEAASPKAPSVTTVSWPATADEFLKLGGVDFTVEKTRRRINLKAGTYQVFGTRSSGLCISGIMTAQPLKISEYEVEINVPPKYDDDPGKKGMCQGRLFRVNTLTKTFQYFEYWNKPDTETSLLGPYRWLSLSFAQ